MSSRVNSPIGDARGRGLGARSRWHAGEQRASADERDAAEHGAHAADGLAAVDRSDLVASDVTSSWSDIDDSPVRGCAG